MRRDRSLHFNLNAMLGILDPPRMAYMMQKVLLGIPCPLLVPSPLDKPFLDFVFNPMDGTSS